MKSQRPFSNLPDQTAGPSSTRLWKKYQSAEPGHETENELVLRYVHLVKTVVGRLAMSLPSHVDQDDLNSAGLLGLLNAVRNFDPNINNAFEAYARLRIRGAALDELRRMDWVPRSVHAKARKVQELMGELERKLGRLPTEQEMASALELSPAKYLKLLDEIRPATFICLDACATTNEGEPGGEVAAAVGDSGDDTVGHVSNRELTEMVQARIQQLPDIQRKVLALYYHEDLRLREIAEICGLCESRICQIHSQAILAIRSHMEQFESGTNQSFDRLAA